MSIWQRQFETPTMHGLIEKLSSDHRKAITTVRDWLRDQTKGKGNLSYVDVAWHWCEQYELEEDDAGDLAGVYLIPDPEGPKVAVSCRRRFFESGTTPQLPKALHAGLGTGVCVGPLAWCEWNVANKDDAEALIAMLDLMRGESPG
ncbi:MAG: hypothetical protein ACF8K1_07225 [Phycisphaerales bacterium JB047]